MDSCRCAEEPETRADEVAAAAERERGADAGGARRRGCIPENNFEISLLIFDIEQSGDLGI